MPLFLVNVGGERRILNFFWPTTSKPGIPKYSPNVAKPLPVSLYPISAFYGQDRQEILADFRRWIPWLVPTTFSGAG